MKPVEILSLQLRLRKEEMLMNNQSFNEDPETVSRIMKGYGGRVESLCSIADQMKCDIIIVAREE